MNLSSYEKCKQMFEIVKQAIDEWNPYALLPDAPADEFDGESRRIAARISRDDSIEAIAAVISNVFSGHFEPEYFGVAACKPAAEKIWQALNNR